jgi:hypothetical protein
LTWLSEDDTKATGTRRDKQGGTVKKVSSHLQVLSSLPGGGGIHAIFRFRQKRQERRGLKFLSSICFLGIGLGCMEAALDGWVRGEDESRPICCRHSEQDRSRTYAFVCAGEWLCGERLEEASILMVDGGGGGGGVVAAGTECCCWD